VRIDQSSYQAVLPELTSGETVLWAGQPNASVIFRKEDVFLIPFSLLWGGFALFWEGSVAGYWGPSNKSHEPWLFGLIFGGVFVVIGQYVIWGRFVTSAWKKRRTHYAVTNRRVIAVQNGFSRKMASAYLDTLPTLFKEGGRGGVGSLMFMSPQPLWSRRSGWGAWDGMAMGETPEFRDISDVDAVYRLVSDQREQVRSAARTV
jgi:hypothetical protein